MIYILNNENTRDRNDSKCHSKGNICDCGRVTLFSGNCSNCIMDRERSKREDFDFDILDRALKRAHREGAWDQKDYDEMSKLVEYQRCGALNSMET